MIGTSFDYMRDSSDFCLYPNDIVERFADKEIIVYSTDAAFCDSFIETFKDKLKIKYVANLRYSIKFARFDCSSELILDEGKTPIKNFDQLVEARKDEPIFLVSRIWWLELIEALEKRGLVRGKDVFIHETGYPMTPIIKKFIEHNLNIWKNEKVESKNKVLIPFNIVRWWFDAGITVSFAYIGNYLAQRHNAEIYCYPRRMRVNERHLMGKFRTVRDIYSSFNVRGFFNHAILNRQQREKAKAIFDQLWSSVNDWKDLRSFELNGINFGTDIIRHYCRNWPPFVNMKSSPGIDKFVFVNIKHLVYWLDYFEQHGDIKAVCLYDGVCREGFLRDIAVAKGIPAYAIVYGNLASKLDMGYPNHNEFGYYKTFFEQLSLKEQEIGLEWAKRSLEARLEGNTKDITYMSKSIYSVEIGDRVLEQNDKLKVIIVPHTLSDDVHCGWSVFGSMIEWMIHLGELSNRFDYDWYLKIHPNAGEQDVSCFSEFVKHYPKIKLIKAWTSPKQLKAEGVKFAFTIYGTVGHEYPALGMQVINAGNNPHVAFDFCYNPKTPEEFDDIVSRLPELADRDVDLQEIYKFYCIQYLYYKHPSRSPAAVFFRRPELFRFMTGKRGATEVPPKIVKRHKYYLDDWTPDFHEITKRKVEELFRDMDSRQDDIFYKNDEELIKTKLATVGLSLD